jgi:hypothetical protein
MSQSIEAPVFTLQYGDIELVIAEPTLSRNTAPFTIFALSDDDLNAVEDNRLLDAFQSQFNRLEELLPKSIPMLRAYATLIIFYRISKNPTMNLTYEQAKARLMGENAEDTLLFIVAQLLRRDDNELRRYFQQPHILVSSLLKVKQDFIFGEGNVIRLFQEARTVSEEKETRRLTMKEFTALYQRLDPHASSPALTEAELDGKEEKEEKQQTEEVEEKAEPRSEAKDDAVVQTPVRSVDESEPPSSSSSSSTSAPVYRSSSSSSSSKKKRAKAMLGAGCVNCHRNDRPTELMLCDRFGCESSCHYDCTVPPLSHVPRGSWFCAVCKPLVKQALDEEESLVVRSGNEEEKKQASAVEEKGAEVGDDLDQIEEISPERWRQAQERWRRDREQYRKELAEKNAEVERLRGEVERFKRQRVEHDDSPMEDEHKEPPMQEHKESPEGHSPAEKEQKESLPNKKKTSTPSRRQPRRAK